ncbi:MAG: diadenylate cyclase [Proteiniphilum sp.]|jgi:DNA integrity scanning protein DisA with diadenylate cyclase activity|uniref:DNA integrity scanning protein DisA nucleotide-binding domain protein n=1 Tax=Proteiniphilum sp. TaxID=1926877 RepID=UPI002B20F5DD|nr:diadenylate cyclase [Proteiniphilum sp.]MEA5128304.1 diadenylate cyclase [Proteiniphilum sp.]
MDNSFFPRTWRGKENLLEEELHQPLGACDLIRIERKFENVIRDFIQSIFNYEKIHISVTKEQSRGENVTGYFNELQNDENGHLKCEFASKLFNNDYYRFSITNIPATKESYHIQVFFRVLMQYMSYFYSIIKRNMPIEDDILKASPQFTAINEIWLYNIERTIIIEYMYNLFNTFDEQYSNEFRFAPRPTRYNLDLINTILDFAYELNTKKIENKEIYCGFIFHDNEDDIQYNSIYSIKLKKTFDFGDFSQIKNYLDISNGQNIFFNVTNNRITHILVTRNKLNEIYINPIGDGKAFQRRPLILSIQGNGKILFLEGRQDNNKVILQIVNSKLIIRDNNFIKSFIINHLRKFTENNRQIELFSKWIMSLSQKKHGTSLIFKEINFNEEKKLVKSMPIILENNILFDSERMEQSLILLDNIVNPDGAVIFNRQLIPIHISTILPIGKSKTSGSGGARHNSVRNYTEKFQCLGIVISEDGPITIFKDGIQLIKF